MNRIRLLPIVMTLLLITFTVRLGDFAVELLSGEKAELKPAIAMAQDEKKDEAAKPVEGKADASKTTDKKTEEAAPDKTTKITGIEEDPFGQEYTDEELKILQSLSERREQIDQRERDLDQREKLLKAAEKKVDEKVVELDKLKKEIEQLLDNQTKVQEENMGQLVKIYENMKPKDAASIFNDMDFDVLYMLIGHMSERKVAPILAAMDPVRAREVSARMAEQRALPSKKQE